MRRVQVLLVAVLGAGAFVATLILQPNLIVGLRSPRAVAWMAGMALVCGAIGFIAYRLGAKPVIALTLAALPAIAAFGLVVVKPIVNPRELTEALPEPVATSAPIATPAPTTPAATVRPAVTSAPSRPTASTTPTAAPKPAATSAPATTTRVSTGNLSGLDGHDAEGRVSTYRLADGSHVIRFENVNIGGTPDPKVYLLTGQDRTGKKGGLHIGALKAEKGSFNYTLPPAFVGKDFTVLVWCEQFAVNIAHATQAA